MCYQHSTMCVGLTDLRRANKEAYDAVGIELDSAETICWIEVSTQEAWNFTRQLGQCQQDSTSTGVAA